MKYGIRTPNLKKSIKSRSTGRLKRTVKKSINPLYGKKGMGFINNPKKAIYNKIYNKTTIGVNDIIKGGLKMDNNSNNVKNDISNIEIKTSKHSKRANNFKKSFWKNGKNIAIIILSFLLFCFIVAYGNSDANKVEELTNQINELEQKNNELNSKMEDNEKQITNLQDANKLLVEEKGKLEEEKKTLETEKQELNTKVEELEKISSTKNTKPTTTSVATTSQPQKSSSSLSSSTSSVSKSSSQTAPASSSNSNSKMVWVGETGTKYHNQGCRTLKGKGHQITFQQAQAEGRAPCKVCH